jgi:hypothetical protein
VDFDPRRIAARDGGNAGFVACTTPGAGAEAG